MPLDHFGRRPPANIGLAVAHSAAHTCTRLLYKLLLSLAHAHVLRACTCISYAYSHAAACAHAARCTCHAFAPSADLKALGSRCSAGPRPNPSRASSSIVLACCPTAAPRTAASHGMLAPLQAAGKKKFRCTVRRSLLLHGYYCSCSWFHEMYREISDWGADEIRCSWSNMINQVLVPNRLGRQLGLLRHPDSESERPSAAARGAGEPSALKARQQHDRP